jgi:hypothetical protein
VYSFCFLNVIKAYDKWSAPIFFEKKYFKRRVVCNSPDFGHSGGQKSRVYVFFFNLKPYFQLVLTKTSRKEIKHLLKPINGLKDKKKKSLQNP